jgi:hypothetical protein
MARTRKPRVGQADLDAARAEGIAIGREEGAAAEYKRFVDILALPEAETRRKSALALALAGPPTLGVQQVQRILQTVAEDAKPAEPAPAVPRKNPFEAAMEQDNPEVGACENVVDGPWRGPTAQPIGGKG